MAHWIDNADSWICSMYGYESNNPNKEKYGSKRCPSCGEIMKDVECERSVKERSCYCENCSQKLAEEIKTI